MLNRMLNSVLFLITLITLLLLLNIDFNSLVLPIATVGIGLSFIFGTVASEAFASFVFVVFGMSYNRFNELMRT